MVIVRKVAKAGVVAFLAGAVLVALAIGGFQLLERRLPGYQDEIEAWVAAQLNLELKYARLDVTWGWRGPELGFRDVSVRTLGDDTPFICGWSCDGTYWNPEGLSNFYLVTYASVAGDDPNPDVQALIDSLAAQDPQLVGTGGFVTGAGAIDAIAAAITEAGSTDGEALADAMQSFTGVPTISGDITFSPGPEGHGVTGREYRVMQIQDGALSFIELRAATSPADVAGAGE